MPWYAKYDGVDGSSQSTGGSRLFVGNLTYDSHDSATGFDCSGLMQWASGPTAPLPDSSAQATMITIEFDSGLHTSDGFFLT